MSENRRVRTAHDVCPVWLASVLASPLRRMIQKPEVLLAGLVKEGQTALDLGCGPGYFTLGMAKLVGPNGKVIAVDFQPEMLARVRASATRAGLLERIVLHQSTFDSIGLAETGKIDFAMSFWMLHEVGDQAAFLKQVVEMMRPGGKYLVVEPAMHVSEAAFLKSMTVVQQAGLRPVGDPKVSISRAVLFQKD
jgi:ubiquinone/menaquinone biosynthesis C-methylase UbiE